MPSPNRPLLVGVLVVAAAFTMVGLRAGEARAQDTSIAPPDSGAARISGFAGLDWGVGRAAIQTRWGVPDTVRPVPSLEAQAYIYADRVILDEDGSMGFLVHPDSGLVRGLYLLPYGSGDDCQRLYAKFRDAVGRTLGDLEGEESMINRTEDLDFCTAFQLGQARARSVWRDTARGGRAWLRLDRSADLLRVSYESPAFERLREHTRRRGPDEWLGGDGGAGGDTVPVSPDSSRTPADSGGGERNRRPDRP